MLFETKSICAKKSGNSEMVHYVEKDQTLSFYSMLHHIERVASSKLLPRNSLRYLKTTLIIDGGGWSYNFCKVLSRKINKE